MVMVRVYCEYPGTDLEPTTVVFTPVGLGDDAPAVHEAFRRLLREREYFEVDTVRDGLLPFNPETVRQVVVWSEGVSFLPSLS